MHEAGIAIAVAAEIRERGLDPTRVRLLVSGGHGDLAAFDAALRAHLEAARPGAGFCDVPIIHLPAARLCAHCARPFDASGADAACPACGGPGIAVPQPESIELAWDDEPASEGPEDMPARDSRLSTPATAGGRL